MGQFYAECISHAGNGATKKMQIITKKEKLKLLSRLYWDMDIAPEILYKSLHEKNYVSKDFDKIGFYRRLLTTYDWYTVLKLTPREKIPELLSDPVIDRIYPEQLRERFCYVREFLSK